MGHFHKIKTEFHLCNSTCTRANNSYTVYAAKGEGRQVNEVLISRMECVKYYVSFFNLSCQLESMQLVLVPPVCLCLKQLSILRRALGLKIDFQCLFAGQQHPKTHQNQVKSPFCSKRRRHIPHIGIYVEYVFRFPFCLPYFFQG